MTLQKPPKPIRDKAHMTFLKTLDCCICGRSSGPPHHLLRGSDKCAGRTAGDNFALPMCPKHHHALHADGNEVRYLAIYGIDGPVRAKALYEAYPDREQGLRVVRGPQAAE